MSATRRTPALPVDLERRIEAVEDPARRETLDVFARALLRRAPDAWLGSLDADALWSTVRDLLDWIGDRRAPFAVRVVEGLGGGSALETNMPDGPFLVDTVREAVVASGVGISQLLHPILPVERAPDGALVRIRSTPAAGAHESVMHVELDRRLDPAAAEALRADVASGLEDLRSATSDHLAMRELLVRMIESAESAAVRYPEDEVEEVIAFLEWLRDGHFVYLGAREYDRIETPDGPAIVAVPDAGYGILRDVGRSRFASPRLLADLSAGQRERFEHGDLVLISKTNRTARVHRRERMDDITVKRLGPDGEVAGELRLLGLFTSLVYLEQAARTPLLRLKLRRILESEELSEGSHDYKAAVAIFESFPRDELFAASADELRAQVMAVLAAEASGRVTVELRRDESSRNVSVLVAMPRDRLNAPLRMRLQELLMERFGGSSVEYHLALAEGELAQLFFTIHVDGELPDVSLTVLEAEVRKIARSWDDDLAELLARTRPAAEARQLAALYGRRLPAYYKSATAAALAVLDVELLEQVRAGAPFSIALQNETPEHTHDQARPLTRLTLAKSGDKVPLGRFLPLLEDIGLTVVEEVPTRVAGADGAEPAYLHDFGVLADGSQLDVEARGALIGDAVSAAWRGESQSDSLSRLVARAGLAWRDVAILRAYRRYRQVVAPTFTEAYQNDVLAEHAETTRLLLDLFHARFAPDGGGDEAYAAIHTAVEQRLDAITSLDEDLILRGFLGLIDATVRTNAYAGREWISLKLLSAHVPQMPRPAPLYEIFVYSPQMEGVHLRSAPVARGGIRWSDRREDYRTEVLGLMKAQMVKNAVIVPDGAKGGFVVRSLPADAGGAALEARRAYETLIRGMLDLTDSIAGGEVVRPPGVRAYDGDDTYLVVAADKGTAAFSDLANALSAEYGFWLGDAFASGGSHGYDHKALGITARGMWESVKRHFREMGHDMQSRPFTVVGIGDMSGDVFGNAMLLSEQIRLVAAFDHRHVFLDPDPDPARSHAERRRLFDLGAAASWADYDPALLSPGGGVYPRSAKSVPLSEEARRALGIDAERLTPPELISAILRAPVDLLVNGGIGTFVKASSESNAEVGDRANDAVRVDARELRTRVVGEGGNLGFTQAARVEYAQAGGRINTDAIDNSAGVDSSDHEVNIKILLALALERGVVAAGDRDALLAELADDVCAAVLYDNYLQVQILSQELAAAPARIDAHEELMETLEEEGLLDRALERLPSAEGMAERARLGQALTRPELSVLMAYAKRSLRARVEASPLPDDPFLDATLRGYFPRRLLAATGELYREHRLRREILSTVVTNDVIDSLGITWVWRCVAETGAEAADVVRAFWIARAVSHAIERWDEVEALFADPRIDADVQMQLMDGVDWMVESLARWYLVHEPEADIGAVVERDEPAFVELAAGLRMLGSPEWRAERALRREHLVAQGVPHDVAEAAAWHHELTYAPDIIAAVRETGRPLTQAAEVFFRLGERLQLDWLEGRLEEIPAATRWQRWALAAIAEDLHQLRREVTERVLTGWRGGEVDDEIERFVSGRGEAVVRLERMLAGLRADGIGDVAAATVAVRQLRAALVPS